MKVETAEQKFNPISIVLETPEEVAKFYAIFNNPEITEALNITKESDVISVSILSVFNEIWKFSGPWYDKLVDAINIKKNQKCKCEKTCDCGCGSDDLCCRDDLAR